MSKATNLNIRISPEMKARIRAAADESDVSVSAWVLMATGYELGRADEKGFTPIKLRDGLFSFEKMFASDLAEFISAQLAMVAKALPDTPEHEIASVIREVLMSHNTQEWRDRYIQYAKLHR